MQDLVAGHRPHMGERREQADRRHSARRQSDREQLDRFMDHELCPYDDQRHRAMVAKVVLSWLAFNELELQIPDRDIAVRVEIPHDHGAQPVARIIPLRRTP